MNNPQVENGYTKIANELVEHLAKLHLSGNEWQIVWAVFRKTWGWNKKEDQISLTQFENDTELSRPSVQEAVTKLVGKKVLVVKKELVTNSYAFNKLYSQWVVPKKVLVGFSVSASSYKGTTLVPKKEPLLVPKKEHTIEIKETYTKDTIQKKYASIKNIEDIDILEIAYKYKVPEAFVQSKLDDMTNWLEASGRRYKNYRAALMNWVKKDAMKILDDERKTVNKFSVTKL